MTRSDETRVARESGDQALARTLSTYRRNRTAAVRQHNVLESTVLVKKRAGFVGAFDRVSDDQVRITDSAQAGLQGAGIVQRCPLAIAVDEAVTPFVRREMIAVPPNSRAI